MLTLLAKNRYVSKLNYFNNPRPYCRCCCWQKWVKVTAPECSCGEEDDIKEWRWENPAESDSSRVVLSDNNQRVTFHPVISSGTAAVKGDTPMKPGFHYYWEVKMLSDTYGTDIMVGLGTDKFDITQCRHKFSSLLGKTKQSYGISYKGNVQCGSKTILSDTVGFCKGSIVGIRLDMWHGTVECYINRESQGMTFYNLRRHSVLYPMVCSTASQSSMKLIYAASWKASLMVDALKILNSSVSAVAMPKLPPGLRNKLKPQFWLTMSSKCFENVFDSLDMEPCKPGTYFLTRQT